MVTSRVAALALSSALLANGAAAESLKVAAWNSTSSSSPAPFPAFVEPYHPTLREQAPSGVRWIHEIKVRRLPYAGVPAKRTPCYLHAARLLRSWEKPAITRRLGSN
jgi:hypothetical protein